MPQQMQTTQVKSKAAYKTERPSQIYTENDGESITTRTAILKYLSATTFIPIVLTNPDE